MPLGRNDLRAVPPDKLCKECNKNKRMKNNPLCALCAQDKKAGGKKK